MSEKVYCKWCGRSYPSIRQMTINSCNRNPPSKRHELYEGGEKTKYECKWCGRSYPSLGQMAINSCNKNLPSKRHEPAL